MPSEDMKYKGSAWRHVKSDHIYVIVGECRLEATGKPAFLYSAPGWDIPWARDKDEFLDGRFEPVIVGDIT